MFIRVRREIVTQFDTSMIRDFGASMLRQAQQPQIQQPQDFCPPKSPAAGQTTLLGLFVR